MPWRSSSRNRLIPWIVIGPFRANTSPSKTDAVSDEPPMITITPRDARRGRAAVSTSPPIDSTMTSNGWPSGSIRSITASAPISRMPAARSGPPTSAVTWPPWRRANWTANRPTPPAAPVISTRLPSSGAPCASAASEVRPATGTQQACSKESPSGMGATRRAGTATRSAQAPLGRSPITRVPAAGPEPSAASTATIPAGS